jgi:hypothetical protein
MGQMSLFSRAEIAGMRDWTAARNHCPERDDFRREHEQHRAWGLQRRHAAKLRHVRQQRSAPPAAPATRGDHTRPTTAARRPLPRQAETPQPSSARAATPQAATTKTPPPQAPSTRATTSPRAAATKAPTPQAPSGRAATSPRTAATKTPAPQTPSTRATTSPRTAATKTPAPQTPSTRAAASPRAATSPRDAARTSPVMAPHAPPPATGPRAPQPAGPQPQTPKAPLPTPPPPEADPTPRRPLTPAAAPGRTSMNFLGHRAPVVTVTPGAVRHHKVRRGHHVVAQLDNTQQWRESGADTYRRGNSDGTRATTEDTDSIHDPPRSSVIFRRCANDFGSTMRHSQIGKSVHSLIAGSRRARTAGPEDLRHRASARLGVLVVQQQPGTVHSDEGPAELEWASVGVEVVVDRREHGHPVSRR